MDVRLPDGTVIQGVPDGTTKAQITEKLKGNGMDVPDDWMKPAEKTGLTRFAPDPKKNWLAKALEPAALAEAGASQEEINKSSAENVEGAKQFAKGIGRAGQMMGEAMQPGGVSRLASKAAPALRQAGAEIKKDPVGAMAGAASSAVENIQDFLIPVGLPEKAMVKGAEAVSEAGRIFGDKEARKAGYVLPVAQTNPSTVNNMIEGITGKIKTQQAASLKNQPVTNKLVKDGLGIREDQVLDEQTYKEVRQKAGESYAAVSKVPGPVPIDNTYRRSIEKLRGEYEQAGKEFPGTVSNNDVEALKKAMIPPGEITPQGIIQQVRRLREEATGNLKFTADNKTRALGFAQREAAEALDGLLERHLDTMGRKNLVNDYKKARKTIAASHDAEAATDTVTGNVDARYMGRLLEKGRPLTGNMKTVAEFGRAFPKSAQMPEKVGSVGSSFWSTMWGGLGGEAVGGLPGAAIGAAALNVGRNALRGATLSGPGQAMLGSPRGAGRAMAAGLSPAVAARLAPYELRSMLQQQDAQ